jgi:alkylation response protein AidB-like acyl-CoA dehydrogenase
MAAKINFPFTRLPKEAQILRDKVRSFLDKEISNGTFQPHVGDGFDTSFSRKVGEQGWIGMTWPKKYGGQEMSQFERYVVTEEMLLAGAPTWAHFTADRQSGPILLKYSSEELKRKILPEIVKGECTFAIGMSEPDSGSDLFAAKTRAEHHADGWLINGRKTWTSFAHRSQYMIGLFRTSKATEKNRRHGLTQFLVDMKTPGITVRPIRNSTGQHDFNDVIFEDVVVPANHMLGELDMAWKQATSELAFERSGPERFLQNIYILTELIRIVGKQPDQHTAERIGRLIAQLQSLRQMSISVAGMLSKGDEPVLEASIVKDVGTNWEQELPNAAREIAALLQHDDNNRSSFEELIQESVIMSPKFTIQGGTREILRGVIARGLGVR